MALKTTIPTLEIKTSGIDLSLVETLYITIKTGIFQTVKTNDNIEVDNDVISVSLTQEESAQISGGGGVNVSIMAVGYDSSVSNVKIIWVNRGSRTDSGNGGGAGSGGESDMLWYPSVSSDGNLTWSKSESEVPPMPVNIKGAKGDPGEKGEQGIPGKDGTPGKEGEDGFSPVIEPNDGNDEETYKLDITTKMGSFTTPNLKGANGGKGDRGDPGDDGASAYDIAVNNGFSGTEAEWLASLKGSDGFSPTIEVYENTDTSYILTITTEDTSFETPNLKGQSGSGCVSSFNGRTGAVVPENGDYTAEMVGAATIEQVNAAIQAAILESWGASY